MLVACDGIGTDIKNKASDLLQDADSKLKQSELPVSPQVATVTSMEVGHGFKAYSYYLYVGLKPTGNAIADKTYVVSLYEKGSLRDGAVVQWNQPELNVLKEKSVHFPLSEQEWDAYFMEDVSHIFSVKIHE
jgi:hypothetical protein